ncbi:hypothetical protein [Rhizobium sp. K102]|uniref:hypothetical protein n=1 Tax=Rhizobium sp. K102 TaxID=2918527 RepID=UPI001EFC2A4E|nr:hypothetical protein [Rhizobium sp. K102]ULR45738.1 hypothetical protein MHI61_11335 [Rhizobium sp. K102]
MTRMLMILIIGAMIASILGILAIKPFDRRATTGDSTTGAEVVEPRLMRQGLGKTEANPARSNWRSGHNNGAT